MVTTSKLRYGRPSGEKDRKEAVDCNTSCLFFGPVMLQSSKEKVFGSYLGNETETSSLCSEVFFFHSMWRGVAGSFLLDFFIARQASSITFYVHLCLKHTTRFRSVLDNKQISDVSFNVLIDHF